MSKKPSGGQSSQSPEALRKEAEDRKAARAETFKRLAVKRVNKAIKALSLVGNLASYKPTLEQAQLIEAALVKAHNDTVNRLKGTGKSAGSFSL